MIERNYGIDAFWLKIIAVVAMTFDHAGVMFFPHAQWMRIVGRLTFPIMAFLIAEGYRHTKNVRRYELRLLVFALISSIPYYLAFKTPYNVFFTLFGGLLALDIADRVKNEWIGALCMLAIAVLTYKCDWGFNGVIAIYIFGKTENKYICAPCGVGAYILKRYILTAVIGGKVFALQNCYLMFALVIAIPILMWYNGRRGYNIKGFFYLYYPLHITIFFIIRNFDKITQIFIS